METPATQKERYALGFSIIFWKMGSICAPSGYEDFISFRSASPRVNSCKLPNESEWIRKSSGTHDRKRPTHPIAPQRRSQALIRGTQLLWLALVLCPGSVVGAPGMLTASLAHR